MCKVIAFDVSKQTLDVAYQVNDGKLKHFKTSNDLKGFNKIKQYLDSSTWVVMEASGPYFHRAAMFFHNEGYRVSVLNPLIINRYSQMGLNRAKTDKKDAKIIAQYAMDNKLKEWEPEDYIIQEMRQYLSAIELLQKQERQTRNQLLSFKSSGILDKELSKTLKSQLRSIKYRIDKLESKLTEAVIEHYGDNIKRISTVKSIGKKTAVVLVVVTNNFQFFTNVKQLIAYLGLSPRIYQSGTSVDGRGGICKMGNANIRKLLYMCTWSAKRCNKGCAEMYERLKEKGKPEKVIKVALMNKLLKQIFAIVKNETTYDENHVSKYKAA